jgi:hypothetical protein
VCDGFGIARDEDGILDESSAIGLTLIPLDEYSEGDGYYEDIKFILYPDDTLFAQFDNPSAAMIELDFKQGPADLYQMLHEAVNASASDAARTRYLRRLRIQDGEYPELGKEYPLKRNISKYIYGKLRIDEDARYRVETQTHCVQGCLWQCKLQKAKVTGMELLSLLIVLRHPFEICDQSEVHLANGRYWLSTHLNLSKNFSTMWLVLVVKVMKMAKKIESKRFLKVY